MGKHKAQHTYTIKDYYKKKDKKEKNAFAFLDLQISNVYITYYTLHLRNCINCFPDLPITSYTNKKPNFFK